MVLNRRFVPGTEAIAQRRPTAGSCAGLLRRRVLGAAHRRALGGYSPVVPLRQHLLAPPSRMDEQRNLGKGLVALAPPARTGRRLGYQRIHGRRHVLFSKKRGQCVGKTKRGKGTQILLLVDHHGLPWGTHIASASPHEVTLIETLLQERQLHRLPKHLLYDLAADSDPLRSRLLQRGIQLICPHRSNRSKPRTQDRRRFRRYKRRYRVERTIGWIQHFRRILVRYERHAHLFLGFVQLACLLILMRRF